MVGPELYPGWAMALFLVRSTYIEAQHYMLPSMKVYRGGSSAAYVEQVALRGSWHHKVLDTRCAPKTH